MFTSAKPNQNSAFDQTHLLSLGFPGGSDNNLPTMQMTHVESLGWEDPLQKGMATHFSILAWRIPWTEEPGGATVHGVTKSQNPLSTNVLTFTISKTVYYSLL